MHACIHAYTYLQQNLSRIVRMLRAVGGCVFGALRHSYCNVTAIHLFQGHSYCCFTAIEILLLLFDSYTVILTAV